MNDKFNLTEWALANAKTLKKQTEKAKQTLTDEEIDDALSAAFNRGAMFGYAEGLKKASEK